MVRSESCCAIQAPNYKLFKWDVFDSMEMCKLPCSHCPVKEFAADAWEGGPEGATRLKHKAFCGGEAHFSNGHLRLEEIIEHYRGSDHQTWMTEYMGALASSTGFVYDPNLVEKSIIRKPVFVPDHRALRDLAARLAGSASVAALLRTGGAAKRG